MSWEQCCQVAARVWCDKDMSNKVVHNYIVHEIAILLYEEYGDA